MVRILLSVGRMGRAWKTGLAVAALFAIPRCSCNSGPPDCAAEGAPHATLVTEKGCGGGEDCQMECDRGFADCDNSSTDGCETATDQSDLHETVFAGSDYSSSGGGCGGGAGEVIGTIGTCTVACELGWLDCNKNAADGCETHADTCLPTFDSGPQGPQRLVLLNEAPRGLVECIGWYFVLDGTSVRRIDPKTLNVQSIATSPGTPAGGLACDGSDLVWTTLADPDAGAPNGQLVTLDVVTYDMNVVATGLDPGAGVATRNATAYFIARSGVGDAGSALAALSLADGAIVPWMPAAETQAYTVFALAPTADWSLANGVVYRRPSDAGASAWVDAGAASALLTNELGSPFAVVHADSSTDAGDASDGSDAADADADAGSTAPGSSDYVASLTDDEGGAALIPIDGGTVEPIVATASTSPPIAASESHVYQLDLPSGGARVVATSVNPIAYVTADAGWVVWATKPIGSAAGAVWRASVL